METDTIKFRRTLRDIGGTAYIALPKEVLEFIDLKINEDVEIIVQAGKHGKYVAIWPKKEDDEKENPTAQD